jgi:hypothetical protein
MKDDMRNIPISKEKITIPVWKKNLVVLLSWTLIWLPIFLVIKILYALGLLHDLLVSVANKVDTMILEYKNQ